MGGNILNKKWQPTVLTPRQSDSIGHLKVVRRAIYIMRSDVHPDQYRFGAIGIRNGNTAVRRLGQCVKVVKGQVVHSWHYFVVAQLPDATPFKEVRRMEKILKRTLIGPGGRFEFCRDSRRDLFVTDQSSSVLKAFRAAIQTASGRV